MKLNLTTLSLLGTLSLVALVPYHRAHHQLFPTLSFSKENVLFPAEKFNINNTNNMISGAGDGHPLPGPESRNPGCIRRKWHSYYVNKNKPPD